MPPGVGRANAEVEREKKRGGHHQLGPLREVVDRFGVAQVMLRDRFAGPHTVSTAQGKAWTAASFRTSTSELNSISQPGMMQAGIRSLPGAVIIGGGLTVEAGGSLLGAIGVSGAPGGDADEACAKAGIEAVRDKLDF